MWWPKPWKPHKFKAHAMGRDWCTATRQTSRAIHRRGLSLPAEWEYCGKTKAEHAAKPQEETGEP